MKQTVTLRDFKQAFVDYNRAEQFTGAGLEALFYYLEELEQDIGEEIELDVVALCCDFCEYEDAASAARACTDWEADPDDDEDEQEDSALEALRDSGLLVANLAGGCIVRNN